MNKRVLSTSLMLPLALITFNCAIAQKKESMPVSGTTDGTKKQDPVLMTIGNTKVTVSEFENVYHKNNNKEGAADPKSLNDYFLVRHPLSGRQLSNIKSGGKHCAINEKSFI